MTDDAWAQRFRGAILGGAVGDVLGAGVRHRTAVEIQRHFGSRGVRDYLPVFGTPGAGTELTQLTVFTMEALLRAKAANREGAEWLPTPVIRANYLRWLYTQGVPWEYAMSTGLRAHPQPAGWLLERPEMFSTRNPGGAALAALGKLALQPPEDSMYGPNDPVAGPGFTDCLVWAAPAGVWETSHEVVFAVGADIAKVFTDDRDIQAAAGLHAEVLGRLIHGERDLWEAVTAPETRFAQSPARGIRRALHGALFLVRDGGELGSLELDAEFDTDREPGELGIALAAVGATDNFADAVSTAVNHSADSSITGALAGQLAGALYGPDGIPPRWLRELELLDIIETLCEDATEAFAPPPPPPPLPKWAQRYVSDQGHGFSGPLELTSPAATEPSIVDSVVDVEPEPVSVPEESGAVAGNSFPDAAGPFTDTLGVSPEETVPGDVSETFADAVEPEIPSPEVPAPEVRAPDVPVAVTELAPEPGAGDFPEHPDSRPDEFEYPFPEPRSGPEFADITQEPAEPAEISETRADDEAAVSAAETDAIPESPLDEQKPAAEADSGGDHALIDNYDYFPPSLTERVLGCFLGGALGDALGADLEFRSAEEISALVGPNGPGSLRDAYGVHGAITDDTQMTLFTAEGLIRASTARRKWGDEDPLPELQLAYQRWLHTQSVEWEAAAGAFHVHYPRPDGWLIGVHELFSVRAPGKTVLRALMDFGEGTRAGSPTRRINDSKGCGGVMRSAPIGLFSTDPAAVFELAADAAALTHGHPSGYLSAGALAVIVQQALLGHDLEDGVWLALQVLETWEGHEETSTMLKIAVDLATRGVPSPQQIAEVLGGGWVGEQALAIAVCAALVGGQDVELALRVAVNHSGDSDSTGALCGSIVGALVGIGGLPMDWLAGLELREVIEQIALDCVAEFGVGEFFPADSPHAQPDDEDWNRRYPVLPPAEPEAATEPAEAPSVEPEQAFAAEPADGPFEEFAAFPAKPPPPASRAANPPERSSRAPSAPQSSTAEDFFHTGPPAPRPAPRRINGIVDHRED